MSSQQAMTYLDKISKSQTTKAELDMWSWIRRNI